MGRMGNQDGRPGKYLGNPLNMLKNFRVWGKKIRHGRVTRNTQFFLFYALYVLNLILIGAMVAEKNMFEYDYDSPM